MQKLIQNLQILTNMGYDMSEYIHDLCTTSNNKSTNLIHIRGNTVYLSLAKKDIAHMPRQPYLKQVLVSTYGKPANHWLNNHSKLCVKVDLTQETELVFPKIPDHLQSLITQLSNDNYSVELLKLFHGKQTDAGEIRWKLLWINVTTKYLKTITPNWKRIKDELIDYYGSATLKGITNNTTHIYQCVKVPLSND